MPSLIYNFLLISIIFFCFGLFVIRISFKKDKEATLKAYRDVTVGLMSGLVVASVLLIIFWKEEGISPFSIPLVICFFGVYLYTIAATALIDIWFLKRK
jgi:uncharacterized membrane protein